MTRQEAQDSIGKEFKLNWTNVAGGKFDIIRNVTSEGYVVGDFIEAPATDCRLKQDVPKQLKQYVNEKERHG